LESVLVEIVAVSGKNCLNVVQFFSVKSTISKESDFRLYTFTLNPIFSADAEKYSTGCSFHIEPTYTPH
ncbi:MAG: hypothetical protein OXD01_06185, partial [Gammaproteobacteria bacterium]|nr:hypothetical protein [Gammaproteobacteria bacterium]